MSRIKNKFETLKQENRAALVTFIMAGDPDAKRSSDILAALPNAGADIIELGMPFTDPAADGLTIQLAGQRALAAGANMKQTLSMVREFRVGNDTTPIILMGYANPIFSYGYAAFAKDAKEAGVDGLIIVDVPPEESSPLEKEMQANGLDLIRLVTPTTDEARLEHALRGAGGFLYYVSITGVTGTAKANLDTLKPHIDMIKSKTDLPIAIGFGIKTPNDAQEMSKLADAVVVGSAIVDKIKDVKKCGEGKDDVLALVSSLSNGIGSR